MTIHKEGYSSIIITILVLTVLNVFSFEYLDYPVVIYSFLFVSIIFLFLILQFFRHPSRKISRSEREIISPADGKVVVIEETEETEFLKDKRVQISIFMSPLNVHVNRYPVGGKVVYSKYHPGLYLVAWHPKSSTENERTTVVVETASKIPILFRQIAGAVARRIVCYAQKDTVIKQGDEMGFIKFGSRKVSPGIITPENNHVTYNISRVIMFLVFSKRRN